MLNYGKIGGIMDNVTSELAKILGKRGGLKTFDKYGKEYMKDLSKKAVEAKKAKAAKRKSTS